MVDLRVNLAPRHPRGLWLSNPVMTASGTFGQDGYGEGVPPEAEAFRLGAIVVKSTTLHPRAGNPTPRIVHGTGWLLNSIGLQNPGIDAVLQEKAPLWASWPVPVILSIAGERVQEFAEVARRAEGVPGIAALEVNASCPNVEGGMEFGQSPDLAHRLTEEVRRATSLPLLVKLTPNVSDIVAAARAVAEAGADALVLTNTLVGMAIDIERGRPVLPGGTGGVSGPALKPVALAMVYKVAQAVSLPLVGVGGIASGRDALEFLLAGASAVQVGSASFVNPRAPVEVLEGLWRLLARRGVGSVAQVVGMALKAPGASAGSPVSL